MKAIIQEIEWALEKYLQQEKDWRISSKAYQNMANQESVHKAHYKEVNIKHKARSKAARVKHDKLQAELIELKGILR